MWLMTPIGFFSAVQKTGDSELTVRARVASDLDALRDRYLATLGPTQAGGGTDYPYRARVSHADFAQALSRIALDIDYANFKTEVGRVQGAARAGAYGRVWSALYDLEKRGR